jgi:IS1 family transposase
MMSQQALDLQQVQADEIRVKLQRKVLWMAMALMVSTRLWLGGVVSERRDMALARQLASQIRHIALDRPLLLAVDGWRSYVRAFQQAFRTAIHSRQRGRPRLVAWPQLLITQVVKHRQGRTLTIERRIVQGTQAWLTHLLTCSQQGGGINTAYIERLNATFRQRLNCLARRTRTLARTTHTVNSAMFRVPPGRGCVYNFCTPHHSLSLLTPTTPAMAAGITDHTWSVRQLLSFKIPTTFQPIKRRGRPPKFVCSCMLS